MLKSFKFFLGVITIFLVGACDPSATKDEKALTAVGKPVEGSLDPFQGDPFFQMQVVFNGGSRSLREPYLAVAVDGTILALQNRPGLLRRSEDGFME